MKIAVNSSELKSLTHTPRERVDQRNLQKIDRGDLGDTFRGVTIL